MKKLVVLMIVFLAVGAAVFAESATVALSGSVEAGAQIVNNSTGTTIQAYDNNEGAQYWSDLNLAATMGDMSANFYLRSTAGGTITMPNYWVTELLMNKMIELRAGNIDNGATGTQNQGFGGLSGMGIQIVANPIDNLSIGALVPTPASAASLSTTLQDFRVGAQYTMPDMAIVDLTYVGGTSGEFDAGVQVTPIKALTVQVEANMLLGSATTKDITLFENASYEVSSALTAGVDSTQVLPKTGSTTITVTPSVSYKVNSMATVYGSVGYTTGTTATIAPEVGVEFPWNSMGTLKVQYDGSFAKTSSNTVNINFIHSF